MYIDLTNLPAEFDAAAQTEPAARYIAEVYRTGVMFEMNGDKVLLTDSSTGLTEGLILWHLARSSRSKTVIETGFGRGGSAAFFLSALAPWNGILISIDPAFRHWAGDTGIHYLDELGLARNHALIEEPSELALAKIASRSPAEHLSLSYIDGSHHFDGTLIDFMYLDRLTEIGGIIAIDDAHAPAVRTVASFVANNLSYSLHYPTQRLLLCKKVARDERDWSHYRPFTSSPKADWDVHDDQPDERDVPGATFGPSPNVRTGDTHEIRQAEVVAAIVAAEDAAVKAPQVVQHARVAVDLACAGTGLRPADLTIQVDADLVRSIDEAAERCGMTRSTLLSEWIRARLLAEVGNR